MYTVLLLAMIAGAVLGLLTGIAKKRKGLIVLGSAIALAAVILFGGMEFWIEKLWFEHAGFLSRFWKVVAAKVLFASISMIVGGGLAWLLTFSLPREKRLARSAALGLGALVGLAWGASNWMTWLRFVNGVPGESSDPILGKSVGFYLFTLPMIDSFYYLLLWIVVIALGAGFVALFLHRRREEIKLESPEQAGPRWYRSTYLCGALLLIVLAAGRYLGRYHLMYSEWGVVLGPGWTDANVRLHLYLITAIVTALAGAALLVPGLRRIVSPPPVRRLAKSLPGPLAEIGGTLVLVLLFWLVALSITPALVQWLRVEPNEITLERPYIEHNIRFTRDGFDLAKVEEMEFPVTGNFEREMIEDNEEIFRNIRLWDYRALDAVYKQFQEIRLYYEFHDVDIDRYHLSSGYREVMVSAREMELANLPGQSQTFVNRRFKYTHGYGVTLNNVSEFTEQGLPHLLVRDIPPVWEDPALAIARPEIYYGELTRTHVIVNSATEEFDYPSGEANRYVRYEGDGGIPISNIARKFAFGWKFDGTRLFFSSYPTPESRLMYRRQILERVRALAPFLKFDADPYIVIADGRLYWIVDAYTTSDRYPYSEPFASTETIEYRDGVGTRALRNTLGRDLGGINYIRNSVKTVVDCYNGNVDFYVFEEEDPLIRVYRKIFPGMFRVADEMPPPIREHVRYPVDMLLVQGLVYAKYHMTDPAVFYNQEDLWIRATEKYYSDVQPVEPYYIMWKRPGSGNLDFVLILPFTPKNRQVMIGWIAGMSDGEDYGRFLAYKFPKEKRVLGPQQVETKIDQDSFLSGQLSLWDQRGSSVIRGNVLAIPVEKTIIYVEPIYLQAKTAAYPELRLVAVMHNDDLSYAETFEKALEGLFEDVEPRLGPAAAPGASIAELAAQAQEAFDRYAGAMGEGDFGEASEALERLRSILGRMIEGSSPGAAPPESETE